MKLNVKEIKYVRQSLEYRAEYYKDRPKYKQYLNEINEVIKKYHKTKSILGVCLGMQAIGEVFGGEIENLKNVYHGVETGIKIINHEKLFLDIPKNIMVGRYHSWVVKHPLPICLEETSFDKKGHLMSLRHKNYKVYGVQFHPESILTKSGKKILQNWIND